jgi:hypothetical protein
VGADTKTAAAKQSRLAVFRGEHVNGVGQAKGDRRLDCVQAIATGFVDYVTAMIHHIGVVARAAKYRVGIGTAVDKVVAA